MLKAAVASATAAALPARLIAQTAPHIVVIGGGFGGANCARYLRGLDQRLRVTLVEANETYTAPPHSNAVLAGLTDLRSQQFGYDKLRAAGIEVVLSAATRIDSERRTIALANGTSLAYDRLVVSPGIAFQTDNIEGYDPEVARIMPAAFTSTPEIAMLRRQLEEMPDGGVVVITSPVNPARCPPAPYERASLIAHYLKSHKPRAKVIVLDAKDSFTMQKLFEAAWQELYPGLIEWVGLSAGGALTAVDAASRTISTDFDKYKAAVASIIPQQVAGGVAALAGVADRTGWCPVDPVSFESKLQRNIHVIGDAAIAGAMPRSASAAQSQAGLCADAIVSLLSDRKPQASILRSSCYSLLAPDYAISQRGSYKPLDDQYVEAEPIIVSTAAAPRERRREEAKQAEAWFQDITRETFG